MGYFSEAIELDENKIDKLVDKTDEILKAIRDYCCPDSPYSIENVINTALENIKPYHIDDSFGSAVEKSFAEAVEQVINDALRESNIKADVLVQQSKEQFNYGEYKIFMNCDDLGITKGYAQDVVYDAIQFSQRGFAFGKWESQADSKSDKELLRIRMITNDAFAKWMEKACELPSAENDSISTNIYLILNKDASLSLEVQCVEPDGTRYGAIDKIENYSPKLNNILLHALDDNFPLTPEVQEFWKTYSLNMSEYDIEMKVQGRLELEFDGTDEEVIKKAADYFMENASFGSLEDVNITSTNIVARSNETATVYIGVEGVYRTSHTDISRAMAVEDAFYNADFGELCECDMIEANATIVENIKLKEKEEISAER